LRWLRLARDHEAGAAMGTQIAGDGGDPFRVRRTEVHLGRTKVPRYVSSDSPGNPDAEGGSQDLTDGGDFARFERETMVRSRASRGRHCLDRVESIHP